MADAVDDDLMKLLRAKKQQAESSSQDLEHVKREWIESLTELFSKMRGWLESEKRGGFLELESREVQVSEHHLGQYQAPMLLIKTPTGEQIRIRPIGRHVVGASGRVDMEVDARRKELLLGSNNNWRFVPPQPTMAFQELDEASFRSALKSLLQ
jgi:hypothetical protein